MMSAAKNLVGKTFGRLIAIECLPATSPGRHLRWRCRCECGDEVVVTSEKLRSGHTKSCGCLRGRHKHTSRTAPPSPTYTSWRNMVSRCTRPNSTSYEHYRKRGIKLCKRWLVFDNFLADMGERPPGTTLDRLDNDGHYEPGNCRWGDKKQQANNRSTNQLFEYRGQTYTMIQLALATGVPKETIRSRLVRSTRWTIEDAINTPTLAHTERRKPRP